MNRMLYHQHVKIYKRSNRDKILFECKDCHVKFIEGEKGQWINIGLRTFCLTRDDLICDCYSTLHSNDLNPLEYPTTSPCIDLLDKKF